MRVSIYFPQWMMASLDKIIEELNKRAPNLKCTVCENRKQIKCLSI